ncbi:MAG: NYN domain-containing protein, partial [Desulfocucumaceae bacterium]
MSKQIAVFWDLDNTFWTLLNLYGNVDNPLERIIEFIYSKYKNDSIRVFRAYADFEKLRPTLQDAQTIIQKRRVTPKHIFSSNAGSNDRKNAGDIELSLDAIETVLKTSEITDYIIISADKDMIPLINRL